MKRNRNKSSEKLLSRPVGTEIELGEAQTLGTMLRRIWKNNKLAVFSFFLILLFIFAAACAPLLTSCSPEEMDLMHRLSPPSAEHPLGTDEGGRDVFSRLLYGARISLLIGVVPTLLSMALGAFLGILAGYAGGKTDTVIMRTADIVLAFPSILLAMVIMYMLGDGLVNVFLTLLAVNWAGVARVVRAETLRLRQLDYVEAARIMGESRDAILRKHILPNCVPTLIVLFTLNVPASILTESSLSFLGLGVQAPAASWGLMVNLGRQFLYNAPWLCFAPCAAIMLTVMAFNFLGDGLRDVLDPHLSRQ